MTQLVLLHSDFVHESVSFRALWGETGPIISDHGACVANAYPLGFQGYPSVLYEDSAGNKHILNLPSTLAEVLAWRDDIEDALLPPTLAEAKAAACAQCDAACMAYIHKQYTTEKQANIARHEDARNLALSTSTATPENLAAAGLAVAPPPDLTPLYTHEDFLVMHAFIEEARLYCRLSKNQINDPAIDTMEALGTLMEQLATQYAGDIPA